MIIFSTVVQKFQVYKIVSQYFQNQQCSTSADTSIIYPNQFRIYLLRLAMADILYQKVATSGKMFLDRRDDDSRKAAISAACKLIAVLETPDEQVCHISWGDQVKSSIFCVALDLGIIHKLSDKPMKLDELLSGIKADHGLIGKC